MKNHLPKLEDLSLFEINSTFAYCTALKKAGMEHQTATFDLFVRDMPKNRNFMVFGGTEEIVGYVTTLKYSEEQICTLLKMGIIDQEMAEYLRYFKFSGTVHALPEGTIFFPGEPIVRVTAPILEANLIHVFLLSSVPSHTVPITKCTRAVLAAKGTPVITNGARGLGFEVGMKYTRSGYIAGMGPFTTPFPLEHYGIRLPTKPFKIGFHAYVTAFPTEIEAFRSFTAIYPNYEALLLVDTYDFEKGVANALSICRELKERGKGIAGIFVDSGNLLDRSVWTRKQLDDAGFPEIKIIAATNMDEYKIENLVAQKAPIDMFMAITEMVTSSDDPKLEIVYKLAEVFDGSKHRLAMKLTPGKRNLPGRKQVYRFYKNGTMERDIIGLEEEQLGNPLLKEVIKDGVAVDLPSLHQVKEYAFTQQKTIPFRLCSVMPSAEPYPVEVSDGLKRMISKIEEEKLTPAQR